MSNRSIRNVIHIKVRIPRNTRLVVQPRQHLRDELELALALTTELSHPDIADALAARKLDRLAHMVLEALNVARGAVPVDSKEIDRALATARVEKRPQPPQALLPASLVARDGGRTQLRAAGVRVHVLLPHVGGLLGAHVGLAGVVRLVEAEDVLCAGGEGLLDCAGPLAQHLGAPEHGHELGTAARPRGRPVVAPAKGQFAEEAGEDGFVVEGEAALVVAAEEAGFVLLVDWGGEGGCGQEAGEKEGLHGDHCFRKRVRFGRSSVTRVSTTRLDQCNWEKEWTSSEREYSGNEQSE